MGVVISAMREQLRSLIERMTKSEPGVNSADSVSWQAHREAEKMDDPLIVQELDAYLKKGPAKAERAAAYFIIGKIGKNRRSAECASVLISHIGPESDKYALAGLLNGLADIPKPADVDLAPIFELLKDKRWLVQCER